MSGLSKEQPEGFEQFVTDQIQPIFDTFKVAQTAGFAQITKFGTIGALIGLLLAIGLYFSKPDLWVVSIALIFVGIGIGLIPGVMKLSAAKDNFSQSHISKTANFLQLEHKTKDFDPVQFDNFTKLGLIAKGDRRNFSNLISGTHNGAEFSIYQAKIEEKRTRVTTDSKGNTRIKTYWVTVFNGQLLHSPYPRKFACTTIISRDQGWFNSKGRFGRSMKPMGLASPKFEKLFEVYTTDQVEGRFLVDPTFMVRLLELENNNKQRRTTAAFFEQGVFVTLQGGVDYFGSINEKSTALSLATETLASFQRIFHFLSMLKGKK